MSRKLADRWMSTSCPSGNWSPKRSPGKSVTTSRTRSRVFLVGRVADFVGETSAAAPRLSKDMEEALEALVDSEEVEE
jgi:hypothetical protein